MRNVYEGDGYAGEYASLDWGGTYLLVRRDLPVLLARHVPTGRALDFGCGTGRSTRLLHELGYDVEGADVAASMVEHAQQLSPGLTFRLIDDGDFAAWASGSFDVILACFPFDNIPGVTRKTSLLRGLRALLRPGGILVNVVSSAEIYTNEWVSFTTADFPANRTAQNEDVVNIVTKNFAGAPVCEDIRCDDEAYRLIYHEAGLEVVEVARPLGLPSDPVDWLSERHVAPWVMWVLRPATAAPK